MLSTFRVYTYNHDGYEFTGDTNDFAEAFTLACEVVAKGNNKWGLETSIHVNEKAFITVRREGAIELLKLINGRMAE